MDGSSRMYRTPDETAADLRGEADPLRLATGERPGRAPEREVVEPDVDEEPQALADLLQQPLGDHVLALREVDVVDEREGLADGQPGELRDVEATHRDRQRLRPQAHPFAGTARDLAHELLEPLALRLRIRLLVTPLDVGHDAFEGGVVRALAPVPVLVAHEDLLGGAVHQDLALGLGQPLPRGVEIDAVGLPDGVEDAVPVLERGARPGRQGTVVHAEVGIGNHELRVDLQTRAEPVARGAGPVRGVEGEVARRQLVVADAAVRARERLRERLEVLAVVRLHRDGGDALGKLERGLHRVGHAPPDVGLGHQAVHHDLDGVLVGLGQPDGLGQLAYFPVDAGAREPLAREVGEELPVLALAPAHDRREDLELGALGQSEHLVDDLVGGLPPDGTTAVRAVRVAHARVEHAQVVVDLGDGAHRGAGVARGALLVDGDGRAEALDEVHVGLLHLAQELPGIGGEGLHVAPLTLGVDGVEGERGLPGAREAREHDELVPRELQRDVLQVVLTSTVDDQLVGAHTGPSVVAAPDTLGSPT